MNDLVTEAKRNKFSQLLNLSQEDVLSVFDTVSEYVQRQILLGKGVNIIGLGTFTLSKVTLDLGNRQIAIQRPVFLLSEKLALTHALQHTKYFTSAQVPVSSLNYTVLSNESPFDRDTIELCIKEVLLALNKYISQQRHIVFVFPGIGKLLIRDFRARMKFYREFVASVDGSGEVGKMSMSALHSRLSVLSADSRPPTVTTVTLPRLVSVTPTERSDAKVTSPRRKCSPPHQQEHGKIKSNSLPKLDEDTGTGVVSPAKEEIAVSTPPGKDEASEPVENNGSQLPTRAIASAPAQLNLCLHNVTDQQNLCYVCHQREINNVPVSMTKYRQQQEQLERKMMDEHMKQSQALSLVLELKKRSEMKKYNKEVAAYNLAMAQQALRDKRNKERNKEKAFVFERSLQTPEPKFQARARYRSQLDEQVAYKRGKERYEKEMQDQKDRLENQMVAEELAADDEMFKQQRIANTEHYKQALAEQVKNKPEQLPVAEPDSLQPIFGVHDKTDGAWEREQRRKAKLNSLDQLKMIADKEDAVKLQNKLNVREGTDMLIRVKQDLLNDLKQRSDEQARVTEILKNSWNSSIRSRRKQQDEQSQWDNELGITVLEQLEGYPRCSQCYRKPDNMGTTNLLTGTRYPTGCKLMN